MLANRNRSTQEIAQSLSREIVLNKKINIYGDMETPLFLAKDVAEWIEHSRASEMLKSIDDDEKLLQKILASGQHREMWFVTEDGLYEILMQSRKPIAKKFKKEIKVILKNIRKTGTHMTPETIEKVLADPDTIIQIATQLKEERAKRMQAEVVLEQQKPKVLFAQAVEASETSILVGQLAKLITQNGISIGQNRLFAWLRENGYLGKKGAHYNEPTQYAIERGWFEVIERTVPKHDGSVLVTRTTKVTGKGQIYFINKLLVKAV